MNASKLKNIGRENGDSRNELVPDNRIDVFSALLDEVRFQREIYQNKANSMHSRSALLIASSGVIVGVNTNSSQLVLFIPSLTMAAISAIFGIISMLPKSGMELGIENLEKELVMYDVATATRIHAHRALEILKKDEKDLEKKAFFVRIGYVSMVASIVLSFPSIIALAVWGK